MKFRRYATAQTSKLNSQRYLPERIEVEPAEDFPPLTLKDIVDIDNDIKARVCDLDSLHELSWSQYLRKPQKLVVDANSLEEIQQPWLDAAIPTENQLRSVIERSSRFKHFDWAFLASTARTDAFSAELVMDYLCTMMASFRMPRNEQKDLHLELRPTTIRGVQIPAELSHLTEVKSNCAQIAPAELNKRALLLATWIEDQNSIRAQSLPLPLDLSIPLLPQEIDRSSCDNMPDFHEFFCAIRSKAGDGWEPPPMSLPKTSLSSTAILRSPTYKEVHIGDHGKAWLMSMNTPFEPVAFENLTINLCNTRQAKLPSRVMPLPLDLPIGDVSKESNGDVSTSTLHSVITDTRKVAVSVIEQSLHIWERMPDFKARFRRALVSYHIPSMPNLVIDSSTLLWDDLEDGGSVSKSGEAPVLPLFIVPTHRKVTPTETVLNADGNLVQSLRKIFLSSRIGQCTIGRSTYALPQCAHPNLRTMTPSIIRCKESSELDKGLIFDETNIRVSSLIVGECVDDARTFHQEARKDTHASPDVKSTLLHEAKISSAKNESSAERATNLIVQKDGAVELVSVFPMNAEMCRAPGGEESQDSEHYNDDKKEVYRNTKKRTRLDNHDDVLISELNNESAITNNTDTSAVVSAHIKELVPPNHNYLKDEVEVLISTPPASSTCLSEDPTRPAVSQMEYALKRRHAREVANDLLDCSQKTPKRPLFDEGDYPSSLDLDRPLTDDVDFIEEFVSLQRGYIPIVPSKRQALPQQLQTNTSRNSLLQPHSNNSNDADGSLSSASKIIPLIGFVRSEFLEGGVHYDGDGDDDFTSTHSSIRSNRAKTIIQTLRVEHRLKMVDVAMDKPVDFALGEGLGMCVLDVTSIDSMAKVRAFTKSLISASLRYDSLWLVIDLGSEEIDATVRKTNHDSYQKVEGPRIMVCQPKLNVSPSSRLPSTALAACLAQLSRSVWHFPCPVHVRYAWGLSQTANLIRIAADAASHNVHEADSSIRHNFDSEEAFNLRETSLAAQLPPLNVYSAAISLIATSSNSSSGLVNLLTMPIEELKDTVPSMISRGRLDDLFSLVHLQAPVDDSFLDAVGDATSDQHQNAQDQQCSSCFRCNSEQDDLLPYDQQTYTHGKYSQHAGDFSHQDFQYVEGDTPHELGQPCSHDSYQPFLHAMDNHLHNESFSAGLSNEHIVGGPMHLHEPFPMTPEAPKEVALTPVHQLRQPLSRSAIKGQEEKLGFRSDPKLRGGQTILQWSRRK